MVTYGANASSGTIGNLELSLQADAASVDTLIATLDTVDGFVNLKGQYVITVADATSTTLEVVNTSANETTYTNVDLIVQEIPA